MKRWRRLRMGLETLAGRPQGFFAPYRYADTVRPPSTYFGIEAQFRKVEPEIFGVLKHIDRHAKILQTLRGPPPVPRWDQSWFPRLDGAAAYALVRRAQPRRIVEVGSGHSTRMLARAAADSGAKTRITCIDPAPRADIAALGVDWRDRVLDDEDFELFQGLQAGDIAFFDSSHLLWPGTDVDIILNRILPMLAPGVLIHIHDILLPDPYPADWTWRGYTEQLGLAGWLFGGCGIVFSSHYALTRMAAAERPAIAALPLPEGARETSLWLVRQNVENGAR